MTVASDESDWTIGPAKWAAVALLGAASLIGLAWALAGTHEAPRLVATPAATDPKPESSAPTAVSPAAPTSSASRQPFVGTLNINTATAQELEALPGIGPALAQRIVADRQEHGEFKTIDEIDRVRGIGPKTVERLRPFLRVQ